MTLPICYCFCPAYTDGVLLVADQGNDDIRVVEYSKDGEVTVRSICGGCALYRTTSLLVSGDKLYIGEYASIRVVPGRP